MSEPRMYLFKKRLDRIDKTLLFGSGKGGVGKSVISASTALLLNELGYRTAYLDLDIHGPAGPLLFPLDDRVVGNKEGLEPLVSLGVKVISLGIFLASNPLPLKGKSKPDLILDIFSAVNWGDLNYLVVDLPPGMGDELTLTHRVVGEKCSLIMVTTPSKLSVNVAERLASYAQAVRMHVAGLVVNMAKLNDIRLFGGSEPEEIASKLGARLLGVISFHPGLSGMPNIGSALNNIKEFRGEMENFVRELIRIIPD
ncbi:MAG: P-loop NTPase [Nitrososphaerota archaeon]